MHLVLRVRKQGLCFTAAQEDGGDKRLVEPSMYPCPQTTHPLRQFLFCQSFLSNFHANEPLAKDYLSLKTTSICLHSGVVLTERFHCTKTNYNVH